MQVMDSTSTMSTYPLFGLLKSFKMTGLETSYTFSQISEIDVNRSTKARGFMTRLRPPLRKLAVPLRAFGKSCIEDYGGQS